MHAINEQFCIFMYNYVTKYKNAHIRTYTTGVKPNSLFWLARGTLGTAVGIGGHDWNAFGGAIT